MAGPIDLRGAARIAQAGSTDGAVAGVPSYWLDTGNNAVVPMVAPQVLTGAGLDRQRAAVVFKNVAAQAVTAGTPYAAWTPANGKKFRLMAYHLSLSVAGSVIFKDGASEVLRTAAMAAGAGQPSPSMGQGLLSTAANNILNLDVTASGTVSGWVAGIEE